MQCRVIDEQSLGLDWVAALWRSQITLYFVRVLDERRCAIQSRLWPAGLWLTLCIWLGSFCE